MKPTLILPIRVVALAPIATFWATHGLGQGSTSPLNLAVITVSSAVLALALGGLTHLFLSARTQLPKVLRPRIWRILPAVLMAILTPVAVFNWVPWLAGTFIGRGLIPIGLGAGFGDSVILIVMSLIATILLATLWYVPSCLILARLDTKPVRAAAYALLWCGAYAAILLATGNPNVQP